MAQVSYVDRQLSQARRQIKWVELLSALMNLAAACLIWLLLVAAVDHWLLDLGRWGRWAALLVWLGGVAYYGTVVLLPLVFRQINPLYAARAIEEGTPSLKNSLINFLLLRRHRSELHRVVYHALESRAASDLARVPADAVVDRSQMIRAGYVLVGVLIVAALYSMLSPKNSFRTVSRVAAPWADLARPSRVELRDILPGDVELYRGESLPVSVVVDGKVDDVRLIYSSTDGQLVDQVELMEIEPGERLHRATLPPSQGGLQRDLTYRIEAGDAVSRNYTVRVSPAPHILVDRLEYDFPDYTRRSPRHVVDSADIEGVEGTRVTIHALANQPIRSAYLDVDRRHVDLEAQWVTLPMEFDEHRAWQSLTLELGPDRRTPVDQRYRLRFLTTDGAESREPIVHRIDVTPDLVPEIAFLTPRRTNVEIALNGNQTIEIRAVDPDFGLSRISLHAVAGGEDLLDETLLNAPIGLAGQQVKSYQFMPTMLDLKIGDQVTYWAVAEDNRQSGAGQGADPNRVRTSRYRFTITPPNRIPSRGREPDGSPANRDTAGGGQSEEGGQGGSSGEQTGGEGASDQSSQPQAGEGGSGGEASPDDSPSEGEGGGDADSANKDSSNSDSSNQSASSQPREGGGHGETQDTGSELSTGEGSSGERSQQPDEPLHDGDVVERVMEYLKQNTDAQESTTDGESPSGNDDSQQRSLSGDSQRGGSQQPSEDASDPAGDAQDDAQPRADSQRPTEAQSQSQQGSSEAESNPNDSASGSEGKEMPSTGAGQEGSSPGAGRPRGDDSPSGATDAQSQPREQKSASDAPATDRQSDSGSSVGEKESDSQGDSGGDQSGGGQQGAGQSADQAGNDSPGSNTAADQGAGAADQTGDGETGDQAGDAQTANDATGAAGDESGAGSQRRRDADGNQAGGNGDPGDSDPTSDQRDGSESPGGSRGSPQGGGLPGENASSGKGDRTVQEGDEANLKYARHATDLVLDYLRDQQRKPDLRLLEELNWDASDVERYVERWERLKRAARDDADGTREFEETLRSLGLQSNANRVRSTNSREEALPGLNEAGQAAPPPRAYRDQFEAFRRARARLGK
jgi:hypothetical protein